MAIGTIGKHMQGVAVLAALSGLAIPALAQSNFDTGGAQVFAGSEPNALVIVGNLTGDTPGRFRQALRDNPGTTTIELLSGGGALLPALTIAWDIHELGLMTRVPDGSLCYSACAYMFLAGAGREVDGQLGVHQFWSEKDGERIELTEEWSAWFATTVRDAMDTFGTHAEVQAAMFETPPEQMHVFTDDELDRFGVEREAPMPVPKIGEREIAAREEMVADGVTRIAKTMPSPGRGETFESVVTLDKSQGDSLIGIMTRSGIRPEHALMILEVMTEAEPNIGDDYFGSEMRILWGPLLAMPTHIPYRVSIYRPGTAGAVQHVATVALSDIGQYVVGVDPDKEPDPVGIADGKGPRVLP